MRVSSKGVVCVRKGCFKCCSFGGLDDAEVLRLSFVIEFCCTLVIYENAFYVFFTPKYELILTSGFVVILHSSGAIDEPDESGSMLLQCCVCSGWHIRSCSSAAIISLLASNSLVGPRGLDYNFR